jgi:hypothetical protein
VSEALRQAGIRPDLIVGCSSGALFGACIATGMTGDHAETHRPRGAPGGAGHHRPHQQLRAAVDQLPAIRRLLEPVRALPLTNPFAAVSNQ